MELNGSGSLGTLVGEVGSIPVYDYSGYADEEVTTEDLGSESASYNLYSGYYANDFYLSHPDNGETGTTGQLANSVIELSSAGLSDYNRIACVINRELTDGEFSHNYVYIGQDLYIDYIPVDSFIDIAICIDDMEFLDLGISSAENCTTQFIGDICDEHGNNYECYRFNNIKKDALVNILNG